MVLQWSSLDSNLCLALNPVANREIKLMVHTRLESEKRLLIAILLIGELLSSSGGVR